MSEQTNIAWTDSTVNFWSGCTKVSAGCANCYAETLSKLAMGKNLPSGPTIGGWGKGAARKLHESAFKLAVRLNKKPWVCDRCGEGVSISGTPDHNQRYGCTTGEYHRRRIFSLSLGDWLDPEVPIAWLARMLDTIRQCDQVTWILCTKRPELFNQRLNVVALLADHEHNVPLIHFTQGWLCGSRIPKNVVVLASVENQQLADQRVPALEKIPAVCRGLSCEPLLGPIQFRTPADLTKIDWVIVGGESGPKARPCSVDWIRSIKEQCQAAKVACFVKQLGSYSIRREGKTRIHYFWEHPEGGGPAEWPEDLRVREFPENY